jgi:hypothetical protein
MHVTDGVAFEDERGLGAAAVRIVDADVERA